MAQGSLEERFVALLDGHRKILYKVVNAFSRDEDSRRDLRQEILSQLWRSFPRFDGRVRFSTWMYRVAMNVAISTSRSERRRASRTAPLDESALEIAAPPEDWKEPAPGAGRLHDLIRDELDELNRAVVILYLDGNGHETIGQILGISTSNVGTRMGRIKQQLREHFDRPRLG